MSQQNQPAEVLHDDAIAWNNLIRDWKKSGMTQEEFCENRQILLRGKGLIPVTPRMLRHAMARQVAKGTENNFDLRSKNPGRPTSLSNGDQEFLLKQHRLYPQHSAKVLRKRLINKLRAELNLEPGDPAPFRLPSYDTVNRYITGLPCLIKALTEDGYNAAFEAFCPTPLPRLYYPSQIYVADSVHLKRLKYKRNGKEVHPFVTFLMDAASRLIVYAILHFGPANAELVLLLLQKAFLPDRREDREGDAFPAHECPLYLLTDGDGVFDNDDLERACTVLAKAKKPASTPNTKQVSQAKNEKVELLVFKDLAIKPLQYEQAA